MIFSMSSLIMTTIICSFAIIGFAIILNLSTFPLSKVIKALPFFILLITIRFLLPIEFPFTRTIRSTKLMPLLEKILSYKVVLLNVSLQNIFFVIWVSVAIIKLISFFDKYKKFRVALNCLPAETKYNNLIYHIMNCRNSSNIKVKIMPGIASPTIVGLFKPVIILPNIPLNESDAYYILSHELQHFKQMDLWRKAICELLKIIYWWNPVMKLLSRQLTMASELNTDLAVTKDFNSIERVSYLDCLLKIGRIKGANPNECFSLSFYRAGRANLKKRFIMVLTSNQDKTSLKFTFVKKILGLILVAISYSIIFEPYILTSEITKESIEINSDSSYIIKDGESYHLFIEDNFFVTLTFQTLNEFENIPIYKSIDEVRK